MQNNLMTKSDVMLLKIKLRMKETKEGIFLDVSKVTDDVLGLRKKKIKKN